VRCTRAEGGGGKERCLKQTSVRSPFFPTLPSQNKTPTLVFLCSDPSALTPPSLSLSLSPLYTGEGTAPSPHTGQSEKSSVSQLRSAQTHTERERERERERGVNERRQKTCNRMLVWVRGKRVSLNTHTHTHTHTNRRGENRRIKEKMTREKNRALSQE